MSPAEIANKTIEISSGDYTLRAGTSKITFDGFLTLYNDSEDDEEKASDAKIPDLEKGDKVVCKKSFQNNTLHNHLQDTTKHLWLKLWKNTALVVHLHTQQLSQLFKHVNM